MTLQEAHHFFKILKNETVGKAESRIYEKFIHILTDLKQRKFSDNEIHSIEIELESLNLKSNPVNRKRYFGNALSKFGRYLKDTFSITTKGYYTQRGVGLGIIVGLLFGIVFLPGLERSLGIALGLSIGMLIGLIIGQAMDAKANKSQKKTYD
jgi:hypothetical protein